MKSRVFTAIVIVVACFSPIVFGGHTVSSDGIANYVVDSLGSLQNAMSSAQPGDLIYIRAGTYQPISQLRFTNSGVSNYPITWRAYPGERVIFDGSSFSGSGWEPPLMHVTGNWNVFENFEVRNNFVGRGIYVAASDCIFRNIISHSHGGSGFYCVDSYRNDFVNVVAHHNVDISEDGESADGISFDSGSGNTVSNCLFYSNSDDGLDTWRSTGNSIENTVCYDNGLLSDGDGNGFKFGPGGGNTIEECVAYNNRGSGFTNNSGAGSVVKSCTSTNNGSTAFENYGYVNTFRDNIAVGNILMSAGAINDHNTWNLGITDPWFVSNDPDSADYLSLQSNSPCRGAASDGTDIGACQYGEKIVDLTGGETFVPVNQPPMLDTIGTKSINEGQPIAFSISGTDSDGDTLSYSASNLPSGAVFDIQTKTFSWTPRYDQAGEYTVTFTVSDGRQTDSDIVTIAVVQTNEDWDVNGDYTTNVLDIILVGQHWGETGLTGWRREDVNEDGIINVLDIIIIGQHQNG